MFIVLCTALVNNKFVGSVKYKLRNPIEVIKIAMCIIQMAKHKGRKEICKNAKSIAFTEDEIFLYLLSE